MLLRFESRCKIYLLSLKQFLFCSIILHRLLTIFEKQKCNWRREVIWIIQWIIVIRLMNAMTSWYQIKTACIPCPWLSPFWPRLSWWGKSYQLQLCPLLGFIPPAFSRIQPSWGWFRYPSLNSLMSRLLLTQVASNPSHRPRFTLLFPVFAGTSFCSRSTSVSHRTSVSW